MRDDHRCAPLPPSLAISKKKNPIVFAEKILQCFCLFSRKYHPVVIKLLVVQHRGQHAASASCFHPKRKEADWLRNAKT